MVGRNDKSINMFLNKSKGIVQPFCYFQMKVPPTTELPEPNFDGSPIEESAPFLVDVGWNTQYKALTTNYKYLRLAQ